MHIGLIISAAKMLAAGDGRIEASGVEQNVPFPRPIRRACILKKQQ
jgi:hypothetical protein